MTTKTDLIRIRISPVDKVLLKAAAREEGLSLSSFVLQLGKSRARELGVSAGDLDHPDQIKMFKGEKI